MALNEIEVAGTSLTLKCFSANIEDMPALFVSMQLPENQFSIDPETAGFHDYEISGDLIRGHLSSIMPFEVESLQDGVVTKTLMHRIHACEFWITPSMVFMRGKPGPQKAVAHMIAAMSGFAVSQKQFEFNELSEFSEKMEVVKAIVVSNPKPKEVRRVRLAGRLDCYTDYNVIDPAEHTIHSVSGQVNTLLGPMVITASRVGVVRLGVKRGFIVTLDCVRHILSMIQGN